MSGTAWDFVRTTALGSWGTANLTCDQNDTHDVKTLAGALYYARTGDAAMRTKVRNAVMSIVGSGACSGSDNEILSMGRQLGAYVMAADYIGLSGADATAFRTWLGPIRSANIGSHGRYKSLVGTALDSPHNWGTFALASLIAADIYLNDQAAVARDYLVYSGYTDRTSYAGFEQISNSWACPGKPFTPANAGCPTDALRYGAWPKDLIRGGEYPTLGDTGTSYTREILQGVAVSAELLYRWGFLDTYSRLLPAWKWAKAHDIYNNHSTGYYITWMVNKRLNLGAATKPAGYGRLFGYTDWLMP